MQSGEIETQHYIAVLGDGLVSPGYSSKLWSPDLTENRNEKRNLRRNTRGAKKLRMI
jgi:hypothetical protein